VTANWRKVMSSFHKPPSLQLLVTTRSKLGTRERVILRARHIEGWCGLPFTAIYRGYSHTFCQLASALISFKPLIIFANPHNQTYDYQISWPSVSTLL